MSQNAPDPAGRGFGRFVHLVDRLSRLALRLAAIALAAGAAIWLVLLDRVIEGEGRTVSLVVVALVLLASPAMLIVLHLALAHLARLPDRLRTLPARAREHAGDIQRLASEARSVRDRGRIRSGLAVIRLWRRASEARDLLGVAAPVAFLLSPATIAASILAVVVAAAQVALGGVACLVLVLG
jgi:hypothetical protein